MVGVQNFTKSLGHGAEGFCGLRRSSGSPLLRRSSGLLPNWVRSIGRTGRTPPFRKHRMSFPPLSWFQSSQPRLLGVRILNVHVRKERTIVTRGENSLDSPWTSGPQNG